MAVEDGTRTQRRRRRKKCCRLGLQGLPMVVCVECLPADKPWDVVSVTRRSSGVAPRACVRVYVRACAGAAEPLHTYIHTYIIGVGLVHKSF